MRFYSFVNANYLSQLQLGIQTAHCVAEMMLHRTEHAVTTWADEHKTIIVLNGGNVEDLLSMEEFFNEEFNPYPFVSFYEDAASLNDAITCVGVILPEDIYETAKLVRSKVFYQERGESEYRYKPGSSTENKERARLCQIYNAMDDWHYDLITTLNSCRMA